MARRERRGDRAPERPEYAPSAGRVPPHDLDAEAAVLAAVLLHRPALDQARDVLKPEHFYSDANRSIFEAAITLADEGQPIDIVSVATWLRGRERLAHVGGPSYLAQLSDATPAVAHVGAHAESVVRSWRLRQFIAKCQRFAAECYGDVGDVEQYLSAALNEVSELVNAAASKRPIRTMAEIVDDAQREAEERAANPQKAASVKTGLTDFDDFTGGLEDESLVIVGARPAMGKTAWATGAIRNVVEAGRFKDEQNITRFANWAGMFSAEMPGKRIAARQAIAEWAGMKQYRDDPDLSLARLRSGDLSDAELHAYRLGLEPLRELPILWDDAPRHTLSTIRVGARAMRDHAARKGGRLRVIAVDYLQLVRGDRDEVDSREQEVSGISRELKELARELKIPVIALCQLNRDIERRPNKRPMMADLRESGAIEQDADMIVFLYRDEYYNAETKDKGISELIVGKSRNGGTETVKVGWHGPTTTFRNLIGGQP